MTSQRGFSDWGPRERAIRRRIADLAHRVRTWRYRLRALRRTERHRCRRRDELLAYNGGDGPAPDRWRRGDWLTSPERWLDRWAYRLRGGGGGTNWRWPWQPRTCSYCGGAHPEDIIRLLDEGWEDEPTDKGYKAYLNPPGHRERVARIMGALRARADGAEATAIASGWSPVPPVKLYVQHFDSAQLERLNAAVRRGIQRRKGAAAA